MNWSALKPSLMIRYEEWLPVATFSVAFALGRILQIYYRYITFILQIYRDLVEKKILQVGILQVYYKYITIILQIYYKFTTNMLQVYCKYVTITYITNILQMYYKFTANMLQLYYKYITSLLQIC